MIEETKIGDFTRDIVAKPAEPTTKDKLEAAEKRLDDKATQAETQLKPRLTYEEQLKEIGVSKEEAADIIDAVLMKGYYSEEIPLTKRISIKLRTRQYRDTQRAQTIVEVQRPVYENHQSEIYSRHALAASLERVGKDVLNHVPRTAKGDELEAAFQERLSYVDALPEPTLRLLFQKLWKFDQKVMTVLSEGVIENF